MSVPNLHDKYFLVVEDDDMSYLYLTQLLSIIKAEHIREKTGAGAIEAFRKNPDFDCILLDIQLPDMDGQIVTREMRRLSRTVPIIAQTASKSGPELDAMLEAGCNSFLVKPFTMEQFFMEMEKVL